MTDSDEDGFQGTAKSSWRRWVVQQITTIKSRLDELLRRHDALNDKLDSMDVEVQADPRRARMGDQLDRIEDEEYGTGTLATFRRILNDPRSLIGLFLVILVTVLASLLLSLDWTSMVTSIWGEAVYLLGAPYSLRHLAGRFWHRIHQEDDSDASENHEDESERHRVLCVEQITALSFGAFGLLLWGAFESLVSAIRAHIGGG